jgi:hypothetical protein
MLLEDGESESQFVVTMDGENRNRLANPYAIGESDASSDEESRDRCRSLRDAM